MQNEALRRAEALPLRYVTPEDAAPAARAAPCSELLAAFEQEALLDSSYFFCRQDSVMAAAQLLGKASRGAVSALCMCGARLQCAVQPSGQHGAMCGCIKQSTHAPADAPPILNPHPTPPLPPTLQLPLSVKDMFTFCMAPASATDLRLGAALLHFATKYRRGAAA